MAAHALLVVPSGHRLPCVRGCSPSWPPLPTNPTTHPPAVRLVPPGRCCPPRPACRGMGPDGLGVMIESEAVAEPPQRAFGDGCGILLVAHTDTGCCLGEGGGAA